MNRDFPENRRSELIALLQQGQKIEAIKVYREATGSSLKEAKEAVEEMEVTQEGNRHPSPAATRQGTRLDPFEDKNPRRGCTNIVVLLFSAAILLLLVFF